MYAINKTKFRIICWWRTGKANWIKDKHCIQGRTICDGYQIQERVTQLPTKHDWMRRISQFLKSISTTGYTKTTNLIWNKNRKRKLSKSSNPTTRTRKCKYTNASPFKSWMTMVVGSNWVWHARTCEHLWTYGKSWARIATNKTIMTDLIDGNSSRRTTTPLRPCRIERKKKVMLRRITASQG